MTEGEGTATPAAAPETKTEAKRKKTKVGVVASNRMAKTITVRVERWVRHPRYHKYIRRHSTLKAHDERGEAKEGDVVRVEETRPLSKTKRWRLVEVVRAAPRFVRGAKKGGGR